MAQPSRRRPAFDAFISHSSADRTTAERIEQVLGAKRVWFDRSDIRLGSLLGRELLSQIRKSRTLVLLWSKRASRSPWVQTEWISAVNLGMPVIPVVLDATAVPPCLANTLRLTGRSHSEAALAELARTVRGRLPRGGSTSRPMRLPDRTRDAAIDGLGQAQEAMFATLDAGDHAGARRLQRRLDRQVKVILRRYPLDPRVAVLWAYNAKNGVLLEHQDAIVAGRRVEDARLDEARWRFLHALWLDPMDPEALNGLGTIAWFGHDLDTAEFFVRAALRQARHYPAARQDLQLILRLKRGR